MGWLLFDFECEQCGRVWEAMTASEDLDRAACTCGGWGRRLPAAPGVFPDAIKEGCSRAYRRWAEQHERPRKRVRHI